MKNIILLVVGIILFTGCGFFANSSQVTITKVSDGWAIKSELPLGVRIATANPITFLSPTRLCDRAPTSAGNLTLLRCKSPSLIIIATKDAVAPTVRAMDYDPKPNEPSNLEPTK